MISQLVKECEQHRLIFFLPYKLSQIFLLFAAPSVIINSTLALISNSSSNSLIKFYNLSFVCGHSNFLVHKANVIILKSSLQYYIVTPI